MTETTQPDPQVARCPWCEGHPRPCADHTAAREPLTVADIPAGQGPASLFLRRDHVGGELDLCFKHADGRIAVVGVTLDQLSGAVTAALTDHLAATLPAVATETAP